MLHLWTNFPHGLMSRIHLNWTLPHLKPHLAMLSLTCSRLLSSSPGKEACISSSERSQKQFPTVGSKRLCCGKPLMNSSAFQKETEYHCMGWPEGKPCSRRSVGKRCTPLTRALQRPETRLTKPSGFIHRLTRCLERPGFLTAQILLSFTAA